MRQLFHGEHRVTAIVGVAAIVAVVVLIPLARYALSCFEVRFAEPGNAEAAATAARFATGFSP